MVSTGGGGGILEDSGVQTWCGQEGEEESWRIVECRHGVDRRGRRNPGG